MRNERGQITIEIVLMLAFTLGIALLVSKTFRSEEYLANLVSGPWRSVAGLVQNGVWGTPEETMNQHPNQSARVNSVRGEEVEK